MPVVAAKVSLEDVRRAIEAAPAELWYDTDRYEDMPQRLGFAICEVSDVFACIKVLKKNNELAWWFEKPDEVRDHKRGGRRRPVRRVRFRTTEKWPRKQPQQPAVEQQPRRIPGHFVC